MLVSAITYVFVCLAVPLVWFWLSRTFMLAFFSPARFEAQMAEDRRKLARCLGRELGQEEEGVARSGDAAR